MASYWQNGREKTAVDIRVGGAGNPWKILDIEAAIDALSGFRQSVDSDWGRGQDGRSYYLGLVKTGNPSRGTFNLMARINSINFLHGLLENEDERPTIACDKEVHDIRVRERCGDFQDLTNYDKVITFLDVASTGFSTNAPLANSDVGDDTKVMQQEAISAGLKQNIKKLVHLNISGSTTTFAINKVVYYADEIWFAITDADVAAPSNLLWTNDDGATWTSVAINTFTDAVNATDLIIAGGRLIVANGTDAPAYVNIKDIFDGTATPFSAASGISANFPSFLAFDFNGTVWAAGAGGYIYKSTDTGFTYESADAASTTTEDYSGIAVANKNLVWFAAANGTLVRFYNGTFSTVAITGSPTDALTTIAVPRGRSNEVYFGTDAGDIYRSTNAQTTSPDFVVKGFSGSGAGTITDLQFAGWNGDVLFVVQTNASAQSRVLRDLSGGNLGNDVEIVGAFTDPSNSGINSLAAVNPNTALVVGDVETTVGYIGSVVAQ